MESLFGFDIDVGDHDLCKAVGDERLAALSRQIFQQATWHHEHACNWISERDPETVARHRTEYARWYEDEPAVEATLIQALQIGNLCALDVEGRPVSATAWYSNHVLKMLEGVIFVSDEVRKAFPGRHKVCRGALRPAETAGASGIVATVATNTLQRAGLTGDPRDDDAACFSDYVADCNKKKKEPNESGAIEWFRDLGKTRDAAKAQYHRKFVRRSRGRPKKSQNE